MKCTQYITFQDQAKTIGEDQQSDLHFDPFNAPGVDAGMDSVLLFKLNPLGQPVHLRIRIGNNQHFVDKEFPATPAGDYRSFHELVDKGMLTASGNEMVVSVAVLGKVAVSDFVLMYMVNIN